MRPAEAVVVAGPAEGVERGVKLKTVAVVAAGSLPPPRPPALSS